MLRASAHEARARAPSRMRAACPFSRDDDAAVHHHAARAQLAELGVGVGLYFRLLRTLSLTLLLASPLCAQPFARAFSAHR